MRLLAISILFLFISCQQDSYRVSGTSLIVKSENHTFEFSGSAKDSLLNIISSYKTEKGIDKVYFHDLNKLELKFMPPPEIIDLDSLHRENVFDFNYINLAIANTALFPNVAVGPSGDKEFLGRNYDAILVATDSSGSKFFWKKYLFYE